MSKVIDNLQKIKSVIDNKAKIMVVTKYAKFEDIIFLLDYGHRCFGENKLQDAKNKWLKLREKYKDIELHFIGSMQSNKIDDIVRFFDVIHSLDSIKKANLIAKANVKYNKNIPCFIQINFANEEQKSGIAIDQLEMLLSYSNKIKLNIVGLMCIPPLNSDANIYFQTMSQLSQKYKLCELSMGMSGDYQQAIANGATIVRIGSAITES